MNFCGNERKTAVFFRIISSPNRNRFSSNTFTYQHWSLYNICTILVQYLYVYQLYKYCTSIVHILYNGRSWYGPDMDLERKKFHSLCKISPPFYVICTYKHKTSFL